MKRLVLIFSVLMTCSIYSQNDSIPVDSLHVNWHVDYAFTIDVNAFLPIDDLRSTLNNSLGIGFYFGLPLNERLRLDLGTSVFFPSERQPIQYIGEEEVLEGGTSLSGALGLWLTHVTPLGKNWALDKRVGSGVGFFQTDIDTGKPKEENDSVHGSETLFISVGMGVRTRVYYRNVGLKLEYFFVPYNMFKTHFPSNFGNSYLTLGLSFGI